MRSPLDAAWFLLKMGAGPPATPPPMEGEGPPPAETMTPLLEMLKRPQPSGMREFIDSLSTEERNQLFQELLQRAQSGGA